MNPVIVTKMMGKKDLTKVIKMSPHQNMKKGKNRRGVRREN
jgi:hypothetical protein